MHIWSMYIFYIISLRSGALQFFWSFFPWEPKRFQTRLCCISEKGLQTLYVMNHYEIFSEHSNIWYHLEILYFFSIGIFRIHAKERTIRRGFILTISINLVQLNVFMSMSLSKKIYNSCAYKRTDLTWILLVIHVQFFCLSLLHSLGFSYVVWEKKSIYM